MKKAIFFILVLISILALIIRFWDKGAQILLGIKPKSGISILSQPPEANVFIDDNQVGTTPFEDKDLKAKTYLVRVEKDKNLWQGKVKLSEGTLTVINRDLSDDPASSSGEILTLDRGKGLTIISNPTDAEVEVDGKSYGKTPQTFNIESGEHSILVSHPGFLKRSIKANLPKDYNLIISADLAISEADLSIIPTPPITQTPQGLVKDTPTGFLRVRDKPSLLGKEITQVKPGDTLILLEELEGWARVRLSDGKEGYVSSSYIEKKNP